MGKTLVELDDDAAQLIEQARQRAEQAGQTLGAYLRLTLGGGPTGNPARAQELHAAINRFASEMAELTSHLPSTHRIDDSRESIYE